MQIRCLSTFHHLEFGGQLLVGGDVTGSDGAVEASQPSNLDSAFRADRRGLVVWGNVLDNAAENFLLGHIELLLRKTHGLEEVNSLGPLKLLAGLGPVELLGHDINDTGKSLEGNPDVKESHTSPAGDQISSSAGCLGANTVAEFGLDEGKGGNKSGGGVGCENSPSTVAIVDRKVLSDICVDRVD